MAKPRKGRRRTWYHELRKVDATAAREAMARIIRRHDGNISRAAIDTGFYMRHLIKIIWRDRLWEVVDQARTEAKARPDFILDTADEDLVSRARRVLKSSQAKSTIKKK
jgi:hypothetical protein